MNPQDPTEHPSRRGLKSAVRDDIAEAKAIAPLIEDAKALQADFRSKLKRWLPLIILLAIAIALFSSGVHRHLTLENLAKNHAAIGAWVDAHPWLAACSLIAALAAIICTGLPGGMILVIAAGLFFGIIYGALLATLADALGASVLYAISRTFMRQQKKPPAFVEKIRAGFQKNPVSFAFFIRLVPVFPYGAASVALTWLGCRFHVFLLSSTAGILPANLVWATLGHGLAENIDHPERIGFSLIFEPQFIVPLLLLALLALMPVWLGLVKKK